MVINIRKFSFAKPEVIQVIVKKLNPEVLESVHPNIISYFLKSNMGITLLGLLCVPAL